MKRGTTPLRSSKPIKRSVKPMVRGKAIRRRSKKAAAKYAGPDGRRAFVERILRERPWCEACERIVAFGGWSCWLPHRSEDVHEVLARSAGGSILDEANVLAVCRAAHVWIGDHPKEAITLGLRRSRYAGRNPVAVDDGRDA